MADFIDDILAKLSGRAEKSNLAAQLIAQQADAPRGDAQSSAGNIGGAQFTSSRSSSGKIAPSRNDLEAASLSNLDAMMMALQTTPVSQPLPIASTPVTTDVSNAKGFLTDLQAAYPDQKVDMTVNADGSISGSFIGGVHMSAALPKEVAQSRKQQFESGVSLLKQSLESSTDPAEKINIAIKLNQMVTEQSVFNYNEYKSQAELQSGVPDLIKAIELIRQQEATAPNRPSNGMPSDQRLALIKQLGAARQDARQYTEELMKGDTGIAQATALAKATLSQFAALDDIDRLTATKEKKQTEEIFKQEQLQNPQRLNRIGAIMLGNPSPDDKGREAIADRIAKGKLKLSDWEEALSAASTDNLHSMLFDSKVSTNPKMSTQIKSVLLSDEIAKTGDKPLAEAHMKILDTVLKLDLDQLLEKQGIKSNPDMDSIIIAYQVQKKAGSQVSTANVGKTNKEKQDAGTELEKKARIQILQQVSTDLFGGNVRGWNGVIKSDPSAQAILSQIPIEQDVTAKDFITRLMTAKDGKTIKQKSDIARQLVASAAVSAQGSAVLPVPSAESFILWADRAAAQAIAGRGSYAPIYDAQIAAARQNLFGSN